MSEHQDGRQGSSPEAPTEGATASGEFGLPPVDEIFFPPVDAFPSAVESGPGLPPSAPSAPAVAAAAPAPPPPAPAPPASAPIAAAAPTPSAPAVVVAAPAPAAPPPAPPAARAKEPSSPGPSESLGRSSARYASAQPHTLQPSRSEVVDQPAVIVEPEALAPVAPASKPFQKTMPLNPPPGHLTPQGAVPAAALGPGWSAPGSSAQQTARVRPPTLVIRPQAATVRGGTASTGPNGALVKVATFLGVLFVVVLLGSAVLLVLDRKSDGAPKEPAPKSAPKAK